MENIVHNYFDIENAPKALDDTLTDKTQTKLMKENDFDIKELEVLSSPTASVESNETFLIISDFEERDSMKDSWVTEDLNGSFYSQREPFLDASTEITKYEGYCEAIEKAQDCLDSRLIAYSRYQGMMNDYKESLLTSRRDFFGLEHSISILRDRAIVLDHAVTICMGWQKVSGVDACSRDLLRLLEEEGVTYSAHDTAYSVKYLAPVSPNGDCLFLSLEQLLLYSDECEPLNSHSIRQVGATHFLAYYNSCSSEEQSRINQTIRNLYHPSLQGGWAVSTFQTRRYIAPITERDLLLAQCIDLQDRGYSRHEAAEIVYTHYAEPVVNAYTYAKYMSVGSGKNSHYLISLTYTKHGLVSVDVDTDGTRVAWGDDIILESLATAYKRDIFVVLVGCGKMFFLPHCPRKKVESIEEQGVKSKGQSPWFLLMRLTGSDRGGDHYEPMLCERVRGDGCIEFGEIGE
ncbi:hypothetical protein ABG067_002078 [Albugo candida]